MREILSAAGQLVVPVPAPGVGDGSGGDGEARAVHVVAAVGLVG